jgi:hypothetical protein
MAIRPMLCIIIIIIIITTNFNINTITTYRNEMFVVLKTNSLLVESEFIGISDYLKKIFRCLVIVLVNSPMSVDRAQRMPNSRHVSSVTACLGISNASSRMLSPSKFSSYSIVSCFCISLQTCTCRVGKQCASTEVMHCSLVHTRYFVAYPPALHSKVYLHYTVAASIRCGRVVPLLV